MQVGKMNKNVMVTRQLLPPRESFIPYVEENWKSKKLTNGEPYHEALKKALAHYLEVKHLNLFANGSLALMMTLQYIHITGGVFTTPYSFVTTSHSLLWNNIKPVFVDI